MPNLNARLRPFAIVAIAISLGAAALPAAIHAWRGNTGDFTHFWAASHAMIQGGDIYRASDGRYVYPPLLAFAFQPLALLPENIAALIWLVCSISLLLLALHIIARELARFWQFDPVYRSVIVAAALVLNFDKVRSLLNLGQTDALILLGFAAVLLVDRAPFLAGIAAGAAGNGKYLSLIVVPYFLVTRRFRAALTTVAAFVALLWLPAVEVGLARECDYLRDAFGGLLHMFGAPSPSQSADIFDVSWNRSVSLTSTVFRATRAYSLGDHVAVIAISLIFIATVAGLVFLRRRADFVLDWTGLILLALIFSPQTTLRHFVLITAPYQAVVALALLSSRRDRLLLISALILMTAALTLPFGTRTSTAVWRWREIGGAGWCALIFLFLVNWAGRALRTEGGSSAPSLDVKDGAAERRQL